MFNADATPSEIVDWCNKEFEKSYQARLTLERQWLLNLAFYYGKQWVSWTPNQVSPRLTEPPKPSWRVRLTVNKIQPYVRREMARLSSQRPRGFVLPASSDEQDRSAARAAESLVEYLHEELDLDAAHDLADWWVCNCGPAYYKVRFTEENDPSTNQPGRLRVDVIRPFDLYVADLEETRIKEQKWVAHVQAMPVDEIKRTFGVDVAGGSSTTEVDQKVRSVMSIFNLSKDSGYAVVKEFWIKPCAQFPNGLVCAVANETLLPFSEPPKIDPVDEMNPEAILKPPPVKVPKGTIEWPYGHGRLPFIPRGHTMSGRFYDTSFVEQLISLQREYNRSRSQIIENKNLTSRPQWAIPIGAVDREQLTTEPGAIIQFVPGFAPPTPIQAPQLPNYVIEHVKLTSSEMDEIASQNEVSKGDVPGSVEAATAIAYLQEKDDAALTYAIRNKERAVQEIMQQLLALVSEFWDVGRMVRVVGMNEVFDSYSLKGEDLRDNTDYRVVSGSGTPISRAAQKAELMQLMESGLLPGSKGLKMLNMPDVAAMIEEIQRDTVEAGKQNLLMSKGQYAPVEIWQDHIAHLEEHDSFKKREEYAHLPDEIKKLFRFHDWQHLSQLAMLFNLTPMLPEGQTAQAQQIRATTDPYYVDTMEEWELRKIFIQLKAGAGAPPPQG